MKRAKYRPNTSQDVWRYLLDIAGVISWDDLQIPARNWFVLLAWLMWFTDRELSQMIGMKPMAIARMRFRAKQKILQWANGKIKEPPWPEWFKRAMWDHNLWPILQRALRSSGVDLMAKIK